MKRPRCPKCNRKMYEAPVGFVCSWALCSESGKAKPAFADIADHEEDTRIGMIGKTVMEGKKTVAFITDADEGKANRYIEKLKSRFPGIVIIERFNGPIEGTVSIKVGPPN